MFKLSPALLVKPASIARAPWRLAPARFVSTGDSIPQVTLFDGSPGNEVNLAEEAGSGKAIVIGVPGAFSPACLASHIPGYLNHLRDFNEKGIKKFFVVAVNDAFVVKAWGQDVLSNVGTNQVRFLADPLGAFAKEWDVLFDASKFFGNHRSKRFAAVVEDGKVVKAYVEPDNTSVKVSAASELLKDV